MADESKEEKPATDQLNLKVVTQDGNEIFFKCKMTTPLQKLMNAFCNRQGVAPNSVTSLAACAALPIAFSHASECIFRDMPSRLHPFPPLPSFASTVLPPS